MLDNEHYKAKFGVDNPNLELIRSCVAPASMSPSA